MFIEKSYVLKVLVHKWCYGLNFVPSPPIHVKTHWAQNMALYGNRVIAGVFS